MFLKTLEYGGKHWKQKDLVINCFLWRTSFCYQISPPTKKVWYCPHIILVHRMLTWVWGQPGLYGKAQFGILLCTNVLQASFHQLNQHVCFFKPWSKSCCHLLVTAWLCSNRWTQFNLHNVVKGKKHKCHIILSILQPESKVPSRTTLYTF